MGKITFRHAGLSPVDEKGNANNLKQQLQNFYQSLQLIGISSTQYSWAVTGNKEQEGTQIDLLIIRKDNVVNLCEMKFYSEEFKVNKEYHKTLVHRTNILIEHLSRKTSIHNTLITTYGLEYNEYSSDFIHTITLDELFQE